MATPQTPANPNLPVPDLDDDELVRVNEAGIDIEILTDEDVYELDADGLHVVRQAGA